MTRKLGPMEFIDQATTPVEPEPERKPDPAAKAAMEQMAQAFGPQQLESGRRGASIFRRLHQELTGVQRGDGSTRVVSAADRVPPDSRLQRGTGKFEMARDWDPSDPKTKGPQR